MMKLLTQPLRLPRWRPYVPGPDDPPIFWFNSEREDIVREVVRRVVDRHTSSRQRVELALNEVAFHEIRRLESQRRNDDDNRELSFYRGLVRRIARMSDVEKKEMLRQIAERMSKDVAGNFDPRVYKFASHIVPKALAALMRPSSLPSEILAGPEPSARLDELISAEGPTEKIRRLQHLGTLVFVPTHVSNLDSVALGYVLERQGLPPSSYGAGKNLFTNPIVSFFMHNLGAYRVDRRVKSSFYKEVLKTYSCVLLERGYHSIFFPGGTRARSGLIETKLKLGLAGTGVEAFARNLTRGVRKPVFFVPATINFALVLEAETLIEDYLKESGKARYIIEDDEFSRLDRWVEFFRKVFTLESGCIIRFSEPLDPFCNEVDDEGQSLGPGGRPIDAATYVSRHGKPSIDPARDTAYTTELGEELARRYQRDTVIMPTQLVAHVLFRRLVRATPNIDLFARLRHRGDVSVSRVELVREVGEARDRLVELERAGAVRVAPVLRREPPDRTIESAIAAFNGYHRRLVAKDVGTEVTAEDPTLLLYYQNRLVPWAQRIADETNASAAREVAVTCSVQTPPDPAQRPANWPAVATSPGAPA